MDKYQIQGLKGYAAEHFAPVADDSGAWKTSSKYIDSLQAWKVVSNETQPNDRVLRHEAVKIFQRHLGTSSINFLTAPWSIIQRRIAKLATIDDRYQSQ